MAGLPTELTELAARVSNRGRWGAEDQRGTLNLIDTAAVQRGVAAARQGRAFSLAIPFDSQGPQTGAIPGRDNPALTMNMVALPITGDPAGFTTSDDKMSMGVQAATHWDALSHVGYGGELYNATPASVVTVDGASRLGIEHFGPVVSRGVLLDIARLKGVDHFEDGYPITADDLDAAVDETGLTIEPGDIVLVRTGHMHFLRIGERDRYRMICPGLSTDTIEWLHRHDVGAVATDTFVLECFPSEDPAVMLPVHMIQLRDMGMAQGQIWFLDDLAGDCAADGQYDFLLTASPVPLTGSTGGIVVPTAVK
ncbi:MAG: cyclase family protein [Microthrixaceae bacterium]|jgi:kynurenine formamidase|nr:cyclase family protein [Microthrixaceae bacterium]